MDLATLLIFRANFHFKLWHDSRHRLFWEKKCDDFWNKTGFSSELTLSLLWCIYTFGRRCVDRKKPIRVKETFCLIFHCLSLPLLWAFSGWCSTDRKCKCAIIVRNYTIYNREIASILGNFFSCS